MLIFIVIAKNSNLLQTKRTMVKERKFSKIKIKRFNKFMQKLNKWH